MLSICVLTFNQHQKLLKDCLESIYAQDIPCEHEILVVDNGADVPVEVSPLSIQYRLIRIEKNGGNIFGQNACFENARGEWVLFVADDVRLKKDCIKKLWDSKDEKLNVGQIQPRLWLSNGYIIDNNGGVFLWPGYGFSYTWYDSFSGEPKGLEQIPPFPFSRKGFVTSTCYLMKKEIFEEIGEFDETLGSSHEDVDMGLRLRNGGYKLYTNRSANATHLGNQTLKHTLSNHSERFHKSRVMVVKKHYKGIDKWTRLITIQLIDNGMSYFRTVFGMMKRIMSSK